MKKIKILAVDDHPLIHSGLFGLLSTYDDMVIEGEIYSGEELIENIHKYEPDVILMDISLPGMDGLETTRLIKNILPTVKVLIMSQYEEKDYILKSLEVGAVGYIPKRALFSDLMTAIRTVYTGETYLYPSVATKFIESYQQQPTKKPVRSLSHREKEILKLVASGLPSKQIANILGINQKTVNNYRGKIRRILGLNTLSELINYAIKSRLIDVDSKAKTPIN